MSDLPNIYSQNTNSCDEEDPEFLFMADVIQYVRYGSSLIKKLII